MNKWYPFGFQTVSKNEKAEKGAVRFECSPVALLLSEIFNAFMYSCYRLFVLFSPVAEPEQVGTGNKLFCGFD